MLVRTEITLIREIAADFEKCNERKTLDSRSADGRQRDKYLVRSSSSEPFTERRCSHSPLKRLNPWPVHLPDILTPCCP